MYFEGLAPSLPLSEPQLFFVSPCSFSLFGKPWIAAIFRVATPSPFPGRTFFPRSPSFPSHGFSRFDLGPLAPASSGVTDRHLDCCYFVL